MKVQAEISLYPLGEEDLLPSIEEFLDVLKTGGLELRMGTMSTTVAGESSVLFQAISDAFEKVAARHLCVLVVKYSNACPPLPGCPERQADDSAKVSKSG